VFVNIVRFPRVKEGKDDGFRKWFEWSNTVYEKFDGFISRRLLKPARRNYVAIVEHESEETYMAMHLSKERGKAWEKVESLLDGPSKPSFYKVMITSEKKCVKWLKSALDSVLPV